jgi:hypothetical protein
MAGMQGNEASDFIRSSPSKIEIHQNAMSIPPDRFRSDGMQAV